MSTTTREAFLTVRVYPSEKQRLHREAKRRGVSVSRYVRELVLRPARSPSRSPETAETSDA